MTAHLTRSPGRSRPYLYLVESDYDHSTRLALRSDMVHRSEQPAPRSPSCLIRRPQIGLVKLPGRLRARQNVARRDEGALHPHRRPQQRPAKRLRSTPKLSLRVQSDSLLFVFSQAS